jgi:polar amino acid transport system permease protein
VSGSIALILNSAAYNAEIIRAGIQSIEKGQTEAARSLGMPNKMAMRHIILPQALRRMIPPLGNELIALLKDSSLVTVIAANDLLYAGKVVAGAHFRFWEPYITVALLYLLLTYIFGKIITYVENRFSNSYVPKKSKGMFSIRR